VSVLTFNTVNDYNAIQRGILAVVVNPSGTALNARFNLEYSNQAVLSPGLSLFCNLLQL
jgi:hypothetical protein